jgi:hypothetical protein
MNALVAGATTKPTGGTRFAPPSSEHGRSRESTRCRGGQPVRRVIGVSFSAINCRSTPLQSRRHFYSAASNRQNFPKRFTRSAIQIGIPCSDDVRLLAPINKRHGCRRWSPLRALQTRVTIRIPWVCRVLPNPLSTRSRGGSADLVCNSVHQTDGNNSDLDAKPLRDHDSDDVRAMIFPEIPCLNPMSHQQIRKSPPIAGSSRVHIIERTKAFAEKIPAGREIAEPKPYRLRRRRDTPPEMGSRAPCRCPCIGEKYPVRAKRRDNTVG